MSVSAAYLTNNYIKTAASWQLLNVGSIPYFIDTFIVRIDAKLAAFVASPNKNLCKNCIDLKLYNWFDDSSTFRDGNQILVKKVLG